jgi:hypothetical protein
MAHYGNFMAHYGKTLAHYGNIIAQCCTTFIARRVPSPCGLVPYLLLFGERAL